MEHLEELYCHIDDFCQIYLAHQKAKQLTYKSKNSKKMRNKPCCISLAEIITLLVLFHQLRYREFKSFYFNYACRWLKREFPKLPSYQHMIGLIRQAILPMSCYLQYLMQENCTGISFIDSTSIRVCDNHRIERNKVFADHAQRGKTSMGWFFGFKLHVVINHQGELVNVCLTKGNANDRQAVKQLCKNRIFGKLFADKGYLSQSLSEWLNKEMDIELITRVRKNMKPKELKRIDKRLLKRRALIETVFYELKHLCQIEHSRHRSITGFMSNLLSGLIAYCHQSHKPTLKNVLLEQRSLVTL